MKVRLDTGSKAGMLGFELTAHDGGLVVGSEVIGDVEELVPSGTRRRTTTAVRPRIGPDARGRMSGS